MFNSLILTVIILFVVIFIVLKAADLFVDNIVIVGEHLGISEIVLGVTAAAIGTSLPEFGSTMIAILSGTPDVGLGTALGADIWNICGILGITAAVTGAIKSTKTDISRDGVMAFLTVAILWAMLLIISSSQIVWYMGLVLLVAYIFYLLKLIKDAKEDDEAKNKTEKEDVKIESIEKETKKEVDVNLKHNTLLALVGLFALGVGCEILVDCVTDISGMIGIPEMFAGILLAFGTTVPEFSTVYSSAKRGLNNLAVGTVLGSNIFNILIGLGVPSLIMSIPIDPIVVKYDLPMLLVITGALLLMLKGDYKLSKKEGSALVCLYIVYAGARILFFS